MPTHSSLHSESKIYYVPYLIFLLSVLKKYSVFSSIDVLLTLVIGIKIFNFTFWFVDRINFINI